ncbi:MAG: MFS transporter [Candidatus Freyarchaeota archaeon]|nr:MFS transporter [Candidatus Jordarchaeia archaeon]
MSGGEASNRKTTLLSLGLANFVHQADLETLPVYITSIARELAQPRTMMGLVVFSRTVFYTVAAPIWGYLADKYSRKKILLAGCIIWGIFTILLAFAQDYNQLLILRILTGIGLASILAPSFGIINDYYTREERGKALGIFALIGILGIAVMIPILGMLDAPSLTGGIESDLTQLTLLAFTPGGIQLLTSLLILDANAKFTVFLGCWRRGFIIVGALSLAISLVLFLLVKEPPKGAAEAEFEGLPVKEMSDVYKISRKDLLEIVKIPTMIVLFAQGIAGVIPWTVLSAWLIHWLETAKYQPPGVATTVFGLIVVGVGIGNALGGYIGDRMHKWNPNRGRILTAQISIFLGIPLTAIVLTAQLDALGYAVMGFITGTALSWSGTGAVQPIVADVTKPEVRGTAFAIEQFFEAGFSAFGALLAGWMADVLGGGFFMQWMSPYAYIWLPVLGGYGFAGVTTWILAAYASGQALTSAMLFTTVVPWTVCLLLFTLAYRYYPADREKIHSLLEERRKLMVEKKT